MVDAVANFHCECSNTPSTWSMHWAHRMMCVTCASATAVACSRKNALTDSHNPWQHSCVHKHAHLCVPCARARRMNLLYVRTYGRNEMRRHASVSLKRLSLKERWSHFKLLLIWCLYISANYVVSRIAYTHMQQKSAGCFMTLWMNDLTSFQFSPFRSAEWRIPFFKLVGFPAQSQDYVSERERAASKSVDEVFKGFTKFNRNVNVIYI